MKAELRLQEHTVLPGHKAIEVWWMGEMIATVTGADGPGVRVISKYPLYMSKQTVGSVNSLDIEADGK